jgi:hypothetical protein
MDSYINYDDWRPEIYGDRSFTAGQMQWLADDLDLAAASGSTSEVLFYHYDFSDQIDLGSLGVEMALWGHIHRDEGSISSPPYDLATDNTCDGARSYRLIRVQSGTLLPSATVSAGSSGDNLDVQFTPANNGLHPQVTAEITNNLNEEFEHSRLRFHMPKGSDYQVSGGTLLQVDSSGADAICYVWVSIEENTTHTVTVTASPPPVNDLLPTLSGDDLRLTWSPPAGITISRFVVYRDTDPVFVPGPPDSIGDTTDTTYIDAGIGNTPDFNHYYAVKAVNDVGQKSDPSNIVGEYDVALGNAK